MSAPAGESIYTTQASNPVFTTQQWAASCSDLRVKRPCRIWKKEQNIEYGVLMQKLASQNDLLRETLEKKRANCQVPGTPEYNKLQQENEDIVAHNIEYRKGNREHRRNKMTAARLYKYEKLEREAGKAGMDFVWYAFNIYQDLLFPYYQQIRNLNKGKEVYIIEDNVGSHGKARRLLTDQILEFDIKFATTPTHSADLHPYEHLHKDQKRLIAPYRKKISSSAAAVVLDAEMQMADIWRNNKEFEDCVKFRMDIRYFKALAERSRTSTPAYGNHYKDSL